MNPLDVCDCIDLQKSQVTWNAIQKDMISRCKGLVLREDRVPVEYKIFRPKSWTNLLVVRSELTEVLTGAGLTGLSFRQPETFKG